MKSLTTEKLCQRYGYGYVGPFVEGLARVRKNGRWFHIKPNGKPAYKRRYDFVDSFLEGLAWAIKGGQAFYIGPDGTRAK